MTSPAFPTSVFGLSDDENQRIQVLNSRLTSHRGHLDLHNRYYDGMQTVQDLGISIPPTLSRLRTVIGWPQTGVDAIDERAVVEGFRLPGSTDTDSDLWGIWQANDLDSESSMAHLETLINGRAFIVVGPGVNPGDQPLITAESPLNMTARWDPQQRQIVEAFQRSVVDDMSSDLYGQETAALYLPGVTIYLARDRKAGEVDFKVIDRDEHGLMPPVVRMANRQRLSKRDGSSEISPAWMNITDSACRTLLGAEVGRELFAMPRRYILGAAEDQFVDANGKQVGTWDAVMGKIWGVNRDENGDLPQVGEFKTGDPKAYSELIDMYTHIMSGLTSLAPEHLGLSTNGNPTSADAIRATEARLVKRVQRKMTGFEQAWEQALRLALLVRDGKAPKDAERIETDWMDPATPTLAATSDAITKQVDAGIVPATSDVVTKRLGYSAVERQRLEQDRAKDVAQMTVREIANQVDAKDIRAVGNLDKALNPPQP